jgi:probable phosphoglycerate mutase
MTTTRLYLARHGGTQLTAEDRFSGASGDLSDEGRAQLTSLGERLQGEGIQAVYCSPLARAAESARIIADACGLVPVARDGLREIDHGHWEDLTHREVAERFPDEFAAWGQDPFTFAPAGGESGVAVLARALPVLREIVGRHAAERVLVVSHKATLRLAICSLIGLDPRGYRERMDQSPGCLNVLDFADPARARLILFNDTAHYSMRRGTNTGRPRTGS